MCTAGDRPRPKRTDPLVTLTRGEAAELARALDEALRGLHHQLDRLHPEGGGTSTNIERVSRWINEEIVRCHRWAQRLRDELARPPMPAHVDDVPQPGARRAK